jgi:DNA-binding MarR family transcriptional regulator
MGQMVDQNERLEAAARLRLATARLARRLRQQVGTGLSPSQQSVLVTIEGHGPLTLGHLARIEQVAPPTITRVVAKLEDDRLVRRLVDARDRRVSRVEITADGRRRLAHSRQRRNAWLAQQLDAVDATVLADVEAAIRVLEALTMDHDTAETADPADTAEPANGGRT